MRGQIIKTDSSGAFSTEFVVEPTDLQGNYQVMVATDPDQTEYGDSGTGCFDVP